LSQAIGWGVNYAKLDHLVFYVNDHVLGIMQSILGKENTTGVKPIHFHGHPAREWIVTLDANQMQNAQKRIVAQNLLAEFDQAFSILDKQQGTKTNVVSSQYKTVGNRISTNQYFSPLEANAVEAVLIKPLINRLGAQINPSDGSVTLQNNFIFFRDLDGTYKLHLQDNEKGTQELSAAREILRKYLNLGVIH
jgi:hypothetical protein